MNDPAVLVLLLEQGDRSLEDHTTDFVFLTNYTHFPDNCLCSFYFAGLNTTTRAQLSGDGPRENFAAYVEWVLVSCNSSLTVDFADDDTSPTLDPEPSQQSPQFAEHEPEPTVDGEPEPNVTDEPSPSGATELRIAQEPEPILSDQVREPATEPATVDVPDGREGAEDSTAHCTAAEGEQGWDLGQSNMEIVLICCEDIEMELPVCPELSTCLNFPPTRPLLSPSSPAASALPPLSPDSPSAHPQPTICAVGSPRVCQSPSASWLEDPSSSPPASESWTPPRPSDPAAPPRLSAPSSPPSPVSPPAPPGSLVPPAPPWSVVVPPSPQDSAPPALPRRSIPPALLGSSLPPAPPLSSVAPVPLRTSGAPPPPRSPEPWAPPRPSGSSESPWTIGSPSPPRVPPPPAPPPSVGPLESSTLPPPWLLPPSAPPWANIMAAAWVSLGSSCSGSLLSPPWLLPPSSPPWTLFVVLFPEVRPPPEPPPTITFCYHPTCPPLFLFFPRREVAPSGRGE
ncbi:hypothetical protein M9458_011215 [Cirrhinus mrigala]|uniref:Uncharacterized protein n=1 Tax=Cirrhinus mrigala TaxID=683832 RepID=A0ABD0R342_CIRMR